MTGRVRKQRQPGTGPLWIGDVICLIWGGMRGSLSLLLSLNLQSTFIDSKESASRFASTVDSLNNSFSYEALLRRRQKE